MSNPIDPTVATCPAPPKSIDRYDSKRPTRVRSNYNVTAEFFADPDWRDDGIGEPNKLGRYQYTRSDPESEYGLRLGFEPQLCIYCGTEGRALRWHDGNAFRTLAPALNRWDLPTGDDGNHFDPLDARAAKALCDLAHDARRFGAKVGQQSVSVLLDIEGTKTYNRDFTDEADLLNLIADWTTRLQTYRNLLGANHDFDAYMMRGFAGLAQARGLYTDKVREADDRMMRLLSGYTAGAYEWEQTIDDPGSWYTQVDNELAYVEEHYPFLKHNRWATVAARYWPINATHPLYGQPVPLPLFQDRVKHLVDNGWHLDNWANGSLEGVKGNYDYLARFANAPAGVN